jgi:hypothetical protein
MCFGGGTPNYTKKDYGALPSLGTGSASKTVTLNEAPAPMRGSRSGSSSIDETMASARASYKSYSDTPSKSGGGIDDQRASRTSALRKKKSLFSYFGFN